MEWRKGFHGPLGWWLSPSPACVPQRSGYPPLPEQALRAFRQLFKECLPYWCLTPST